MTFSSPRSENPYVLQGFSFGALPDLPNVLLSLKSALFRSSDATSSFLSDLKSSLISALSHQLSGGVSSHRQSRFERATRLLATFVCSHRSLRLLAPQRSALLHSLRSLAPFTGSLTHFAHSLVGQWKFLSMCSRCYRISRVHTRFSILLETRPF